MRGLSVRKALFGLIALVVPVVLAGSASGQGGLVITDLNGPRGLSQDGSQMLIAEQGTGNILKVTQTGTTSVVARGLPTSTFEEDGMLVATGVTAAINIGGTIFATVGEAEGEDGFDAVYTMRPGQTPVLLADLHAYEVANNVDGDVDQAGDPELLVNAYDLVSDSAGGVYVSASGANAIFHVASGGAISTYAIFPNVHNPLFPNIGGPYMDQVPTGIEWGPDGALYVATLTGFPFPTGAAVVYRVADGNSDGDALDEGEVTTYASGLTTATNLVFDSDGSLLVTEFSTSILEEAPGRLVRVEGGEITDVVAAPLVSPTGVTIFNGQVIVTQEFLGIVAEASAGAEITASLPPPPGGDITPPNTGDAGLAAKASSAWMLYAGGLIALACAVSSAALVRIRR